jgi:CHAT domain-containing protein
LIYEESDVMWLGVLFAGLGVLAGCGQSYLISTPDPDVVWLGERYQKFRRPGLLALQKGDYAEALKQYHAGAEAARRGGDAISEARFLANLSTAHMLRFDNRAAIRSLLNAREAARRANDSSTLQSVEANLTNVYIQTGDYEAAALAAARGAAIHPPRQQPDMRIGILLTFARAAAKTRGLRAAEPALSEALHTAGFAAEPLRQEAEILDMWGYEALEAGQWDRARDMLSLAWYKRVASRDPRQGITEGKLARLYRKRGEFQTASQWMSRVRAAIAGGSKIPVAEWNLLAEEGHIAAGLGRLEAALERYRLALDEAATWRQALPPAERLRLGAERRITELVDAHLRTAARLQFGRPSALLSAEMFSVLQQTRAWSLEKGGRALPGDSRYAQSRRLEGRWLAGDLGAADELRVLRAAILEDEQAQAPEVRPAAVALETPADGEAVLTFWLDEGGSWLWLWTRDGLRSTPLPARSLILRRAAAFREAVAANRADIRSRGTEMLDSLLGALRQECLRARRWDIVADEGLFQLPFAALPLAGGRYLTEAVELRLVPNALRESAPPQPARRFLAIADPVYNLADERHQNVWFWQRSVYAGRAGMELPRLPGTRREAESARAAWQRAGFATALLQGAESGEEAVLARLGEWQPGIIHIATHTVTPAGDGTRPRLALALRPDGSPGLLAAEDIATLRLKAGLVVLSACHSAGQESVRGSGLLGLTRAWLTAGSRQVLATLWPVPDESTAFFQTFHESLAAAEAYPNTAAAALRAAQLASLKKGGAAAEPRQWAGHVLLARR